MTKLQKQPKITPMMAQFFEIKQQYQDCLLFFRMGDFYELFFEDAEKAAPVLDINLTKRGKHLGEDVPMCGVPFHSSEPYLNKLIREGFKVAICDQVESPEEAKKRKSIVRRDVVRIVTPGTLTEDALLDARKHNYLVSIVKQFKNIAISWVDLSTGDFHTKQVSFGELLESIDRLSPSEIVLPEKLYQDNSYFELLTPWRGKLTVQSDVRFNKKSAEKTILAHFDILTLESFGQFSDVETIAAGSLLDYVQLTQKGKAPHLKALSRQSQKDYLQIDPATRRNLELMHSLSGSKKGGLIHQIDKCITATGSRLLSTHLLNPLTNVATIEKRLDHISCFVDHAETRLEVRNILKNYPDVERAFSRISIGRAGPRDLGNVRDGLRVILALKSFLLTKVDAFPAPVQETIHKISNHHNFLDELEQTLMDELPFLARDGKIIRPGFAPHLDHIRSLRDESQRIIKALQEKYRADTGIASLKVKHNNVIGYHVEVPPSHASKMHEPFIHRQTLGNSVRFTTAELVELEEDLVQSEEKTLAIELEIYHTLIEKTLQNITETVQSIRSLAQIDCFSALAEVAAKNNFARPTIKADSQELNIRQGRHPVVEAFLGNEQNFVSNDCTMDEEENLWLISGPNMSGKSTFLRQNALIVILAQMGSFVPAASATIGIVDKVFSRVGASDDLASGRSTFMVEMVETATILNQATENSFVILDEIGRGTATFDGLSIAWAVTEHLHNTNKCRVLFATHYHELNLLKDTLKRLACYSLQIKEWDEKIIFLHKIVKGEGNHSYGINVAALAGLPKKVISRAKVILEKIESEQNVKNKISDLPLFGEGPFSSKSDEISTSQEKQKSYIEERIEAIRPDELTPKAALEVIYELKKATE